MLNLYFLKYATPGTVYNWYPLKYNEIRKGGEFNGNSKNKN